jgi:AraC-like DNA-binding protein
MAATASDFSAFRFSTDDLPERDRIAIFREWYGRKVMRLEMEGLDGPFHADVTARMLPGLGIMSVTSSPVRVSRTRELLADGDDALVLILNLSPALGAVAHLGNEAALGGGDAVLVSNADAGTFAFSGPQGPSPCVCLRLPRKEFAPLLRDHDTALVRAIPAQMEALQLLKRYLKTFEETRALTPELQYLVVAHIYDLAALAIGATRDTTVLAEAGGIRAARLAAIKAEVMANLGRRDLSAGVIGKSQGITADYIRKLFAAEGASFMDFVLEQRLTRAHRMLTDPRFAGRAISAIALDAGFSDLSYFNRTFRRRFGETPSDVRESTRRKNGG